MSTETTPDTITPDEADTLVYEALVFEYMPFAELVPKVGVLAGPEVRASLLRLQEQGKAALVYGQGWRKLRKVVPNA